MNSDLISLLQNWEFEGYVNNRSISYTHDSTLFIKPVSLKEGIEKTTINVYQVKCLN